MERAEDRLLRPAGTACCSLPTLLSQRSIGLKRFNASHLPPPQITSAIPSALKILKRQLLRLARKRNLATGPRQNNPTGKSPKPCPALPRKIFRLTSRPNHRLIWLVSPDERGGSRSSRTCGGMRWTRKLRLTSAADVYGENVWF
jgi:hypothetical protein